VKSVLCIDCGASSTKWSWRTNDGSIRSGRAAHITGHIFEEAEWERVTSILREVKTEIGFLDEVVIGVTGLDGSDGISKSLKEVLKSIFQTENVTLMNDMELAFSAFFAPGEGVLVYAGTGSVAASIDKAGSFQRSGGWGYLIADEGGGFWIGQQALRYVTNQFNCGELDWSDPLITLTMAKANAKDWDGLRKFVYSGSRQAVASIAPEVAVAKLRGSKTAEQILREAGSHLAALALTLQKRLGTSKFIAMGGVFKIDAVVFESLAKELHDEIQLVDSDVSLDWIKKNLKP
jgi:N-acetylglucosamine kinase-like BadF-type ATPase